MQSHRGGRDRRPSASFKMRREHIESLRKRFEALPCKCPADQEIRLEFCNVQLDVASGKTVALVSSSRSPEAPRELSPTASQAPQAVAAASKSQEPRRQLRVVQLAQLIIKSGAKNALSGKMISELTERLDELERWAWRECDAKGQNEEEEEVGEDGRGRGDDREVAKCLLVRGHGGTFCSGSDLITVRSTTTSEQDSQALAELMQFNFGRLAQLPLVSVAFVEGYALGGGAEFALAADMRLMSGE